MIVLAWLAAVASLSSPFSEPGTPPASAPPVQGQRCDTDADLDRILSRLDRDGDGILTSADTRQRLMGRDRASRPRLDPLIVRLDRDGDGRVTRAELDARRTDCQAMHR